MTQFAALPPSGEAVQQLEMLLRAALFKTASELVGFLLQQAADRIDAAYQPKAGQVRKGRESLFVCFCLLGLQGLLGICFCARRTGNGENGDGRRGERGSVGGQRGGRGGVGRAETGGIRPPI